LRRFAAILLTAATLLTLTAAVANPATAATKPVSQLDPSMYTIVKVTPGATPTPDPGMVSAAPLPINRVDCVRADFLWIRAEGGPYCYANPGYVGVNYRGVREMTSGNNEVNFIMQSINGPVTGLHMNPWERYVMEPEYVWTWNIVAIEIVDN